MLVVILGAGASFDSDPERVDVGGAESRPPLAAQLFDTRQTHRNATNAFDRCVPAAAQARADVSAGATVEDSLGQLQERAARDPRARSELMAVRFYLQRVLTEGPDEWLRATNRMTNYVTLLDQLQKWAAAGSDRDYCLINFNYDLLVEDARRIIYGDGAHADNIHNYVQPSAGPRLYKPHGSVNWNRAALWAGTLRQGDDMRRSLIEAPPTEDDTLDQWQVQRYLESGSIHGTIPFPQTGEARAVAYLPVLAIPVEAKPGMVMPTTHQDSMRADLRNATQILSIGWRGREAHFLDELRACVPGQVPLVSVAESEEAARETTDNLMATGRIGSFRNIGAGFSGFAPVLTTFTHNGPAVQQSALDDMLRGQLPFMQHESPRVRITTQRRQTARPDYQDLA